MTLSLPPAGLRESHPFPSALIRLGTEDCRPRATHSVV